MLGVSNTLFLIANEDQDTAASFSYSMGTTQTVSHALEERKKDSGRSAIHSVVDKWK